MWKENEKHARWEGGDAGAVPKFVEFGKDREHIYELEWLIMHFCALLRLSEWTAASRLAAKLVLVQVLTSASTGEYYYYL
jgi:hypothetical protein